MSILFILSLLCFASSSYAMDMKFPIEQLRIFEGESVNQKKIQKGVHSHGCKDLGFDKEQEKAYREVIQVFNNETFDLRRKHKIQRKKYFKSLREPNSTKKSVLELKNRLIKIESDLISFRSDLFHFLIYELAKNEQRRPLLRCLNHMRHHVRLRTLRESEKKHRSSHNKRK